MKNLKITIASLLFAGAALLVTGCGHDMPEEAASSKTEETTAASETEAEEEATEEETTSADTTTASSSATTTKTTTKTTTTETTTAAETTTQTTTAGTTAAGVVQDFTGIAGYWYIDGDPFAASMHISSDGRFTAYYASGAEETSGYVRKEKNTILNNYFFVLYLNNDEEYMMFADDGEADKSDIYIGSQGTPHYVKLYGEGGAGDDGRAPGEEYVGFWNWERATLTVEDMGFGVFHASIQWSDSAWAYVKWDYPMKLTDGKLVCDGGGTKSYIEYKDGDSEPTVTIEYTDGSAELDMTGSVVKWLDKNENRGSDVRFERVPE